MLCLTRKVESRTNLYLDTPTGKRLLGQIVVRGAWHGGARLGFEFADDVLVSRDETDTIKARVLANYDREPRDEG